MGFIKGALIFFLGFLLFLSIFASGVLLALSSSLKYENLQPQVLSFSRNLLKDNLQDLDKGIEVIRDFCNLTSQDSDYTFNYSGYTFVVPCSMANQSSEEIVNYEVNYLFNQIYYKNYECGFWECVNKDPLFLVSEKSYEYWRGKFYFALMISLILIFLIFLLMEKKANLFILTGILTIIPAILLRKLSSLLTFILKIFLPFRISLSEILNIFLNQSHSISMKMIFIGASFLIFGIVLRIFGIGMKIASFFEKIKKKKSEDKEETEKEVKKKIEEESK